jgi:hypothetical protein
MSLRARAQDPVTLPGVKVVGTADKPGPKLLVGIVVDTSGKVIGGVEVSIPGLTRRLFTNAEGTFRFDSVKSGKYRIRARKIGYAPQVREVEVDSAGGVAEFQLLPIVTALPAMVSSASMRGLSGTVSDMSQRSVPGANVRLLGTGMRTTTDMDGNFFIAADAGRYMVGIEKEGYKAKLVGVTVPKDSGRHMDAWLMPSLGPGPRGSSWIVEDVRERQAWTLPQNKVLYTHEDLVRMKIEWIYDAVDMNFARFGPRNGYSQFDRGCAVVVNGGPGFAILEDLTIDDVESIEIYAPGRVGSTTSATQPRAKSAKVKGSTFNEPSSNTLLRPTQDYNWAHMKVCPRVYIWSR